MVIGSPVDSLALSVQDTLLIRRIHGDSALGAQIWNEIVILDAIEIFKYSNSLQTAITMTARTARIAASARHYCKSRAAISLKKQHMDACLQTSIKNCWNGCFFGRSRFECERRTERGKCANVKKKKKSLREASTKSIVLFVKRERAKYVYAQQNGFKTIFFGTF